MRKPLLAAVLPPNGPLRRFALMTLIDAIGTSFFLVGSVIFFVRITGLGIRELGLGLSLAAAVGLLTAIPAGRLADRLGYRRLLVALNIARALLTAAYLLID